MEKYRALNEQINTARAAELPAPIDPAIGFIAVAPLDEMMTRIKEKDFTLGEWLYFFIDRFVAPNSAPAWVKQSKARITNHLQNISSLPMTQLTGLEIHSQLNSIREPRTREYTYQLVKRGLQKAYDLRMLDFNPAMICEVKIEPKEIRDPLELEEQEKLVEYLLKLPDSINYKDMILWTLWTGLRPSESARFRIEADIDWTTGLFDIHGTKTRNAIARVSCHLISPIVFAG